MSIDVHKKFWPQELHGRGLNCPRKSLRQSKDNKGHIDTQSAIKAFSQAGSVGSYHSYHTQAIFLDYI